MDQREEDACGAHWMEVRAFDYTCDDCMLPWNHLDPEEINDLENTEKRVRQGTLDPEEQCKPKTGLLGF